MAAVTACLVVAVVGVLVHVWTENDVRSRAEAQAFNTLYSAVDVYRRTGTLVGGAELNPAGLPTPLRDLADGDRHTARDGHVEGNLGPSVWAAQRTGGPGSPVLAVQINMSNDLHTLRMLDVTMVTASLIALTAATPLAVYGAGLLARRLRRVSQTAARISGGDLDARTGPTRGSDEVADIAATVDLMADSLSRRLRTERQFTADVAHELRTPVGGLLAAADLLAPGETENAIRTRVRDLRGLVEDLLEISRLDAGVEEPVRVWVPLGAVVREAVARTGLDTEVTIVEDEPADDAGAGPDGPVVETDPRRLERIIGNLVVNAHRHGGTPVRVTVHGRTVAVRDHGPGFPDDLLLHGPRRFHTGAPDRGPGHGLGLTIAQGQASVLGADLRLDNTPDSGAIATLRLPA
ncbi:ATP-binding protein [Kitasatospora sp. NPDC056651]|uniref:HAMP domain-containing sensor histidine kinase n=1 Tax=Kitasatospora sp. NPDC056651 TaxID=3345892 RepID=UPI0036A00EB9